MKFLKAVTLSILSLLSIQVNAQKNTVDSLQNLLQTTEYDSVKVDVYNQLTKHIGVAINNLDSATYYADLALNLATYKKYSKGIAKALSNKGVIAYYKGEYTVALEYFINSLAKMEELNDWQGAAAMSNNIGVMYDTFGQIKLAQEQYEKSLFLRNKFLKNKKKLTQKEINTTNEGIASANVNLGNIKEKLNKYDEAIAHYDLAFKNYQNLLDTSGMALVYGNIGLIYQFKGDYAKGVSYYQSALDFNEKVNNKSGIATAKNNIGNIFFMQGNYDKALENYQSAYAIASEINDLQRKIESGINLGNIYSQDQEVEKAITFFTEALEVSESLQHVQKLSFCYNNLGTLYQRVEMYNEAIEYYNAAKKLAEDSGDKKATIIALVNIGVCKDNINKREEAYNIYTEALTLANKIGTKHDKVFVLRVIYYNFIRYRTVEESKVFLDQLLAEREEELSINYFTLSEEEKIIYLKSLNEDIQLYFDFATTFNSEFKGLASKSYDLALKVKGLSLRSSKALRNSIQNSGDQSLIKMFEEWISLKNEIALLYGQGEDLTSKMNHANDLEKNLILKSSSFNIFSNQSKSDWKSVQKKLNNNEAAIEFVQFLSRTDAKLDAYYAAIILTKNEPPRIVQVCNVDSLKLIFGNFQGNNLKFINQIYGSNNSVNTELYNLIWKPLEKYLENIDDIYLSPIGLLHKISFSALGSSNDHFLIDKHQINLVNSTGQIKENDGSYLDKNLSYLMMGGVNYNSDSSNIKVWDYLDGSLSEVEKINSFLKIKNENTELLTGDEVNEKSVLNKIENANIIHIATHGFFFPDPLELRKEIQKNTEFKEEIIFRGVISPSQVEKSLYASFAFLNNPNPLMRSGIALAHSNDVWSRSPFETGADGVLTAQEVSLLDLRKTQLVVLSACETGLGDIVGSEGVFGLQRAFKMAGAKKLIISLWKVPDAETAEFMELFYKNIIIYKNTNEAFTMTQKTMRNKYDPYYWAAFVLVN